MNLSYVVCQYKFFDKIIVEKLPLVHTKELQFLFHMKAHMKAHITEAINQYATLKFNKLKNLLRVRNDPHT